MKCKSWTDQHDKSVGQRKNLSPATGNLPSLFTSFTDHAHDDFDSADPSRMLRACHIWTQLNDLALMSSPSSLDRAPVQCSGSHGFDSFSHFITRLKIHHIYSLITAYIVYQERKRCITTRVTAGSRCVQMSNRQDLIRDNSQSRS